MNTTHSPPLLLNLNKVATQLLRWTRRSVERQIAERRLRTVHLGRSVRVERTELDRFLRVSGQEKGRATCGWAL